MILITGGTGFIGSRIILRLLQARIPFRVLLRPTHNSPKLPIKNPLDVAVSSFDDERGLRAALRQIKTIFHFASSENSNHLDNMERVDVIGTQNLVEFAREAGVRKILFLSRIGANFSSYYPILHAKALAESSIQKSGVSYQILRLSDVFGAGDHFTTEIAAALNKAPIAFPYPGGDNHAIVQPLWIEDLLSLILFLSELETFPNKVTEIGGGEYLEFSEVVHLIMQKTGKKKLLTPITPAYLRSYNLWFRKKDAAFPLSTRWLDLLAVNRTCPLDSLPRNFSILPARFDNHLEFLTLKIDKTISAKKKD